MGKSAIVSIAMTKLLQTLEGRKDLLGKVCHYFIENTPISDSKNRDIILQILRNGVLTEGDHEFLLTNRIWATQVINHLHDFAQSGHFYERIHGGQAPDGAGGRTKGAGDGWNR